MTPEADAWARVDNELARRIAIQASIARKTGELVRMMDPALRHCSHAEHVRRLVVQLGTIGALDPDYIADAEPIREQLQKALVDLAADVQALMEANLREVEYEQRYLDRLRNTDR